MADIAFPSVAPRVEDAQDAAEIKCVTQDPREPASAQFLAVCTVIATEVATSRYCPDGECGGHPVCAPCLTVAIATGLVTVSAD